MTNTELFSSGLLETYVLGVAGNAEKQIVEAFAGQPQVANELSALAAALEKFAGESAVQPPGWDKIKCILACSHE